MSTITVRVLGDGCPVSKNVTLTLDPTKPFDTQGPAILPKIEQPSFRDFNFFNFDLQTKKVDTKPIDAGTVPSVVIKDKGVLYVKKVAKPPDAAATAATTAKYRERLTAFYKYYNPDRLGTVEETLKTYQGKEDVMFQKLVDKYGPEPKEMSKDALAKPPPPPRRRSATFLDTDGSSRPPPPAKRDNVPEPNLSIPIPPQPTSSASKEGNKVVSLEIPQVGVEAGDNSKGSSKKSAPPSPANKTSSPTPPAPPPKKSADTPAPDGASTPPSEAPPPTPPPAATPPLDVPTPPPAPPISSSGSNGMNVSPPPPPVSHVSPPIHQVDPSIFNMRTTDLDSRVSEIRGDTRAMQERYERELNNLRQRLDSEMENRRQMESRSLMQYQMMLEDGQMRLRKMEDDMHDVIRSRARQQQSAAVVSADGSDSAVVSRETELAVKAILDEMRELNAQLKDQLREPETTPGGSGEMVVASSSRAAATGAVGAELMPLLEMQQQIATALAELAATNIPTRADGSPSGTKSLHNTGPLTPGQAYLVDWLRSLGLERYVSNFLRADFDIVGVCAATEADLVKIGIHALGARRKILAEARRAAFELGVPHDDVQAPRDMTAAPSPARSRGDIHSGGLTAEQLDQHVVLLQQFYSRHDPSRVPDAPKILREFAMQLSGMYATLCSVYNIKISSYRGVVLGVLEKLCPHFVPAVDIILSMQEGREAELIMDVVCSNVQTHTQANLFGDPAKLWTVRRDAQGTEFYYNAALQVSQWLRPASYIPPAGPAALNSTAAGARIGALPPNPSVDDVRHAQEERAGHYRHRLSALLIRHDPRRLSELDALLKTYGGGREEELLLIIRRMYGA
eukprot:PhM_4_TR648/c0_g1_i1/m.18766